MTLTEFLLARIAEDAEWAQEALDLSAGIGETREWRWVRFYGRGSASFYKGVPDPARVLAECEAKRVIAHLHGPKYRGSEDCESCGSGWEDMTTGEGGFYAEMYPCLTARNLGTIYADHPDYRPEWRP